jgi:hypothetical protein
LYGREKHMTKVRTKPSIVKPIFDAQVPDESAVHLDESIVTEMTTNEDDLSASSKRDVLLSA